MIQRNLRIQILAFVKVRRTKTVHETAIFNYLSKKHGTEDIRDALDKMITAGYLKKIEKTGTIKMGKKQIFEQKKLFL